MTSKAGVHRLDGQTRKAALPLLGAFDGCVALGPAAAALCARQFNAPVVVFEPGAGFAQLDPYRQKELVTQAAVKAGVRKPLVVSSEPGRGALLARFSDTVRIALEDGRDAEASADLTVGPGATAPEAVAGALADLLAVRARRRKQLLVLYDDRATHIATVREYLAGFAAYSRHQVHYAIATNDAPCTYALEDFDGVLIHYSVRLSMERHLSAHYARRLAAYVGLKLVMIQDEYDTTETARQWFERLGIDCVLTCVPADQIEAVYPSQRFSRTQFVQVLTGYVPEEFAAVGELPDPESRPILIGYRGRPLPFWYGKLGREKYEIGVRMRELCQARGLPVDIEWAEQARIYGTGWYDFIKRCRAMLGTESGSNLFDDDGSVRAAVTEALRQNPALTFEDAHARYMAGTDGRVRMNQISPKIFEAVAFKTALILFEGEYSGVLVPGEHFIPLKKDYSNVDEALAKVQDAACVREMTERAYRDVIGSGAYSYKSFIEVVDEVLAAYPTVRAEPEFLVALVGERVGQSSRGFAFALSSRYWPSATPLDARYEDSLAGEDEYSYARMVKSPLFVDFMQRAPLKAVVRQLAVRYWRGLPDGVRGALKPAAHAVRSMVRRVWR